MRKSKKIKKKIGKIMKQDKNVEKIQQRAGADWAALTLSPFTPLENN